MSVIETKEIGIDTGINIGTFHNTEYVNGSIQLKRTDGTINNKPVYEIEGYWESEIIDLVGKFREYDRVALSKIQGMKDIYAILTRVSDNGVEFSDYIATAPDGKVQSEMKRFIQVKLVFYAGLTDEAILISDFKNEDELNKFEDIDFVEIKDESLGIKREYLFDMEEDTSWSEDGSLHRKLILRDEWKKIDSLGVDSK